MSGQIFLNLAHNSPEISQILCAALFNHLETTFVHGSAQRQYILCGGIISSLSELIEKSSDTFREVRPYSDWSPELTLRSQSFVRQAGVQRIVDVYNKASQMILSSQVRYFTVC